MNGVPKIETLRSIRLHLAVGVALVVTLGGVFGGWAAVTPLAGAVVARGSLVVDGSVKRVQHLLGGSVTAILVKEGDRVTAGQLLVKLDSTVARTNLQIVTKRLDEARAREARALSERDALFEISFPSTLTAREGEPDVASVMAGERSNFRIRREALEGQKAQLKGKTEDLEQATAGLRERAKASAEKVSLLNEEIANIEPLLLKKLVTNSRVLALKRDRAESMGDDAEVAFKLSETSGEIQSLKRQLAQLDFDTRAEASRELGELRVQIAEQEERSAAAVDELSRIDIRAPLGGIVNDLSIHTVGGVVKPGETIMDIVPLDDQLLVEVKISPADINDIYRGQSAKLRFSGLNIRTTPEVQGELVLVSSDISEDPRTGQRYYSTRIRIKPGQVERLGDIPLIPGMPVEVFVETVERTVMSYLVQPLSDQVARAFKDK